MSLRHRKLDGRQRVLAQRVVFIRDNYRCLLCGRAYRSVTTPPRCTSIQTRTPTTSRAFALCRSCHVRGTAQQNRLR